MKDTEKKRTALGKGIHSLLGDEIDSEKDNVAIANRVLRVRVDHIEPNPHQPRKVFVDEELKSLSQSIEVDGIIQPIIVTKTEETNHYMLVAGERRWRAAKMAGLTEVPVIIKEGEADTILRVALIENIQRADLTIIEEAEAYKSLIDDFGLSQDQCAQKVGKDRSTITNALRLLKLPKQIQDDLLERRLTMGHGRALLTIEDSKMMLRARDVVIKKSLSVRQTELLCKKFKREGGVAKQKDDAADLEYIADAIRTRLRTKVKLSGDGKRGKIEVFYFSAAELERLVDTFGVELS